MSLRHAILTLATTGALAAFAPSHADDAAAQVQGCFYCATTHPGATHPLGEPRMAPLAEITLAAGAHHKYRIDEDVVVRGWKMSEGLYFGHTRSRLGRAGVGVTYDSGATQYTLNHQGFTVTRRL